MGLFGSNILEFALSVIFIYLLVAVIASAISEWISTKLAVRSSMLREGVRDLFAFPEGVGDFLFRNGPSDASRRGGPVRTKEDANREATALAQAVFEHPLIQTPRDPKLLTYIPSRTFALALFDHLTQDRKVAATFAELRSSVETQPETVRRAILPLLDASEGRVEAAREAVAQWFDEAMSYVSTRYKKRIQVWLFVIGLTISVLANVDSLKVYESLWNNDELRTRIAKEAETLNQDDLPEARAFVERAKTLDLPIGPSRLDLMDDCLKPRGGEVPRGCEEIVKRAGSNPSPWNPLNWDPKKLGSAIVGWLITAVAAALGAPFWFDLLNKVANLRTGGQRPEPAAPPKTGRPDTASNAPLDKGAADQATTAKPAPKETEEDRSREPGFNEVDGETG